MFERLIETPDPEIESCLLEGRTLGEPDLDELMQRLRRFHGLDQPEQPTIFPLMAVTPKLPSLPVERLLKAPRAIASGVPEGLDALLLGELARHAGGTAPRSCMSRATPIGSPRSKRRWASSPPTSRC